MKKLFVVLIVLSVASTARAQTWDEWFRQKRTRIKYLLQQIVALKTYGFALRKGYDLANDGLGTIATIKGNDLSLHQNHFASLLMAKQGVKNEAGLQSIVTYQRKILSLYHNCKKQLSKNKRFSAAEKTYFDRVLTGVLQEAKEIGEEASLLLADGAYQMTDDERIKRLQTLTEKTGELYTFARRFETDVALAALHRIKEERDAKALKSFY